METPVKVTFETKRHSRRPYLRMYVKKGDGSAFDFTGAVSARFVMYDSDEVEKVSAAAIIESPVTSGVLRYEWAAADVDTYGEFRAEFDIEYPAAEPMTLPLNGNILVRIYKDVNDA